MNTVLTSSMQGKGGGVAISLPKPKYGLMYMKVYDV
jgi:hypothetical protein